MNERDSWTLDAMERFGGSFVKNLAKLAWSADPNNLRLIKETFRGYWEEYQAMGIALEKENA